MKKTMLILTAVCMLLVGCGKRAEDGDITTSFVRIGYDCYNNGVIVGGDRDSTKYLDFETMEKVPLCAVPNCTHSDNSCIAKMTGQMPIFYNDSIYFFQTNGGDVKNTPDGKEFYIDSKLKKASLYSSQIDVVCEFHDAVPPLKFNAYVLRGSELYFVGDDYNPVKDDYGGYSWGNTGGNHYLCCIDLDTGEYTNFGNIYDDVKNYEASQYSSQGLIGGVYNDKMYVYSSFYKTLEEIEDPDRHFTTVNFEFDFDTKTLKQSELPSSKFMNDETYTYYDYDEKMLHIIDSRGDRTIPLESRPVRMNIVNDKLFYSLKGKWFDLSDLSEHSMGDYVMHEVVGFYDGCYIMVGKDDEVKVTEEELLAAGEEV